MTVALPVGLGDMGPGRVVRGNGSASLGVLVFLVSYVFQRIVYVPIYV